MSAAVVVAGLAGCAEQTVTPFTAAFALQAGPLAVTPAAATLAPGTQQQLTAVDGSGQAVSVRWKSSNTAVAQVSASGLVTAVAAGAATITAQAGKDKAAASITVAAAPAVASVIVSPAAPSLTTGATVQLTATALDAAGTVITGRPIAWRSSNDAVASVSATGLATAVAAGSAQISATIDGRTGSAAVTVTAPAPPPPVSSSPPVNECATMQPGWIFCDDFETDRMRSYFEITGGTSFTRSAQVGVGGSTGMRARFSAGQVNAGSLKLAFGRTPNTYFRPVDAGTRDYREIYWRFFLRNQPGWTGGGGNKLTRIMVFATPNWAQAMAGHLWTGNTTTYLTLDPTSGTDAAGNLITSTYNDPALRWLGSRPGKTTLFDAAHVGAWYCVETRVRLNDPGMSNGVFEFWIDGALEASRADLNWLGSYSAYGLNALFLENYWNAGSPVAQERYFDHLVVSTQRIGC